MTKSEQDEILEIAVKRLRHLHEDLDDEDLRQRLLAFIITAALCNPDVDVRNKFFDTNVDMLVNAFMADDYFDDEEGIPLDLDTKWLFKRQHLLQQGIRGDSDAMEQVKRQMPAMGPSLTLVEGSLKTVEESIPTYRENLDLFEDAVFMAAQAMPLMHSNSKKTFSEEAMKLIRGYDAGMGMVIAFGSVLRDIRLPKHIRESLLFKILWDGVWIFSALINDVLGLNKDVKNSATMHTVILRKVVREGIPLKQSFDEEVKRLKNVCQDIQLAAEKLLETFPEETSVKEFIRYCFEFCDGQTYAYILLSQLKLRYGSTVMEVIPAD